MMPCVTVVTMVMVVVVVVVVIMALVAMSESPCVLFASACPCPTLAASKPFNVPHRSVCEHDTAIAYLSARVLPCSCGVDWHEGVTCEAYKKVSPLLAWTHGRMGAWARISSDACTASLQGQRRRGVSVSCPHFSNHSVFRPSHACASPRCPLSLPTPVVSLITHSCHLLSRPCSGLRRTHKQTRPFKRCRRR